MLWDVVKVILYVYFLFAVVGVTAHIAYRMLEKKIDELFEQEEVE